mgnify:CR=1|tara:strand:- start:802 stop:963 length:162 start_codon:yes stop_codon:yes gene_type:complete
MKVVLPELNVLFWCANVSIDCSYMKRGFQAIFPGMLGNDFAVNGTKYAQEMEW